MNEFSCSCVSLLSIVQTSSSSPFWVLTNWENTACHSKIVAARDDDASSSGSSFFFFFPCLLDVGVKNPQSTANQSASFLPSFFLPAVYDLQPFEDCLSERETEREQKLKSAKAFWRQQQQVQQHLHAERKAEAKTMRDVARTMGCNFLESKSGRATACQGFSSDSAEFLF